MKTVLVKNIVNKEKVSLFRGTKHIDIAFELLEEGTGNLVCIVKEIQIDNAWFWVLLGYHTYIKKKIERVCLVSVMAVKGNIN